jgi:hypothetical protein
LISEVKPVHKEVKKGSDATVSCVLMGIKATATISWRTSSGEVSGVNFTPTQGTFDGELQTSTLAVKGNQVNTDTVYTCRVNSGSLSDSEYSDTTVNLNVYGMLKKRIFYNKAICNKKAHGITPLESVSLIICT